MLGKMDENVAMVTDFVSITTAEQETDIVKFRFSRSSVIAFLMLFLKMVAFSRKNFPKENWKIVERALINLATFFLKTLYQAIFGKQSKSSPDCRQTHEKFYNDRYNNCRNEWCVGGTNTHSYIESEEKEDGCHKVIKKEREEGDMVQETEDLFVLDGTPCG